MFLLHIALEAPLAIQGMFAPQALPFLEATNTTLVMIKVRLQCISEGEIHLAHRFFPLALCSAIGGLMYHGASRVCSSRQVTLVSLLNHAKPTNISHSPHRVSPWKTRVRRRSDGIPHLGRRNIIQRSSICTQDLWSADGEVSLSSRLLEISPGIDGDASPFHDSMRLTPENTWGLLHAVLGLGFAVWWQVSAQFLQLAHVNFLNALDVVHRVRCRTLRRLET
jgi:hypothetical protein